jgi:hypothetical protein
MVSKLFEGEQYPTLPHYSRVITQLNSAFASALIPADWNVGTRVFQIFILS